MLEVVKLNRYIDTCMADRRTANAVNAVRSLTASRRLSCSSFPHVYCSNMVEHFWDAVSLREFRRTKLLRVRQGPGLESGLGLGLRVEVGRTRWCIIPQYRNHTVATIHSQNPIFKPYHFYHFLEKAAPLVNRLVLLEPPRKAHLDGGSRIC